VDLSRERRFPRHANERGHAKWRGGTMYNNSRKSKVAMAAVFSWSTDRFFFLWLLL
jgi:hypothetical protein